MLPNCNKPYFALSFQWRIVLYRLTLQRIFIHRYNNLWKRDSRINIDSQCWQIEYNLLSKRDDLFQVFLRNRTFIWIFSRSLLFITRVSNCVLGYTYLVGAKKYFHPKILQSICDSWYNVIQLPLTQSILTHWIYKKIVRKAVMNLANDRHS